MCGIFGIHSNTSTTDVIAIQNFLEFIDPRGPDGSGEWQKNWRDFKVRLWHSRLSIIDVSDRARQPMQDEACDWVITYNGEIFNYLEIREELRALGWAFHSDSDTEVLLKAWAQWGIEALPRLNGMFAFAVVHQYTGEMWLVRDRFGVKPLLWGLSNNKALVFSSSTAAVAKYLNASVSVDYCAFGLRYRAFESASSDTPFIGVNAVSPGSWLKIHSNGTEISIKEGRWYDLANAVAHKAHSITSCTDDELLDQCRTLVHDAVQIRLRSDVPLAVSLSGGLDSSTVAAMAARQVNGLHGFTFGSPDAQRSEGPVVERFSRQTGITPHFIWPAMDRSDLDELLERTLTCQEAPFPGLSVMAQNEIFCAVRKAGFKVLLGGQGGDEAFAGYRKFFVVAIRHALLQHDVGGVLRLLHSLGLMLLSEAGAARVYWHALSRYHAKKDVSFKLLDWSSRSANLWGGAAGNLSGRQIEDVQRWSIPTLLRYEDRNSMGHGVESRLPFMDYRLMELALALPARLKIADGYGKWAIRNITRGTVPDFIRLNRKKRGFDVTQSWVSDGLGASLRERIDVNRHNLAPHMRKQIDVRKLLSDEALQGDSALLDEALMLAWLSQPVRTYTANVWPK